MCEDKDYCILKGNKCLRKCSINNLNGSTNNLDLSDIDNRCVGSLIDFEIKFREYERDFSVDSSVNTITIKLESIKLIDMNKRVHFPILKSNGGLLVSFKCIGNNARDTDFELPINYSLSNDDYILDDSQNKLILGNKIDEINIEVPKR